MNIHSQIIEKDGRKEFVVIPYDQFLAIQEALADLEDLRELREAREASRDEPSFPLEAVRDDLLND